MNLNRGFNRLFPRARLDSPYLIKRANRGRASAATRYISSSGDSDGKPSGLPFKNAPGPLPLGDAKEQRRIAEMIDKVNRENTPPAGLSAEELEKFYDPVKDSDDPLKPFPNNTNPATGEVNGPRGPEPTRFGDWERKGRVSDF